MFLFKFWLQKNDINDLSKVINVQWHVFISLLDTGQFVGLEALCYYLGHRMVISVLNLKVKEASELQVYKPS
jgi:hypothetical protein